ncbi:MAG: lactonase family protein [Sphingobium sp.]|nr:lactonase family protein [Sphingobium sp.]
MADTGKDAGRAFGRDHHRMSLPGGSEPRLYVGTYARNGGAGLHSLHHSAAGVWSVGDAYPGAPNASFGAYSVRHDLHYFVDEQADGAVGAFRETEAGWRRLARLSTRGAEPCYVALDAAESCLAVANYASGSIAVFRVDDRTGLPVEPPALLQNRGAGPVEDRQDGPHAHCACFGPDRRWLFQVDLGTDEILTYAIDAATGSLGERRVAFRAPAGSGPRHLVFHPVLPLALLVSELASTLTVLEVGDGILSARQMVSTLPPGFSGESLGGHLSLNSAADRVYVTNRGHDSIAIFAWDASGSLEPLQHAPSGGRSPRSFVLLEAERLLLLVNEEDGKISVFNVRYDGTLSPTDATLAIPGAAFLFVGPPG